MTRSEIDILENVLSLNISNDQYYNNVNLQICCQPTDEEDDIPIYGMPTIIHSLPGYDLWKPFFPTIISEARLLSFHRPKLRLFANGPLSDPTKFHPVKSLMKSLIDNQRKLKLKVIRDINRGLSEKDLIKENFLIKYAPDLTAKFGELVLLEYCEEHPPILSQISMASNIRTYTDPEIQPASAKIKQKMNSLRKIQIANNVESLISNTNAQHAAEYGYKTVLGNRLMKPLYYNILKPGRSIQVIENNLSRAPIYPHNVPETDFLVIRTRNSYYIRPVQALFTVGQVYPLVAIPFPYQSNVTKFRSEFALIHANKLMAKSRTRPKSFSLEDLVKNFPDLDVPAFRKRLSKFGVKVIRRHHYDAEDLIFQQGTSKLGQVPLSEMRRRLTPEQYCINTAMIIGRQRLRNLNYRESAILEQDYQKMELEVKAAPWNTSKAVLEASMRRCYLDLKAHLIDPTGQLCNEGFSCIPIPFRNSLKNADKGPPNITKNPPTKNSTMKSHHDNAQVIAEIQEKVLASAEVLSSDEDEFENDGSQCIDEHDIENMVFNNKTWDQLETEKEEAERTEFLKELMSEDNRTLTNNTKCT